MQPTTIAADIAEDVFQIATSIHPGNVASTHRPRRESFLGFFVNLPVATVVMEACGSAHYWGRRTRDLGHHVELLPHHRVKPYVQRSKNDRADAKAIHEAYRNADIRRVPSRPPLSRSWAVCIASAPAGWSIERDGSTPSAACSASSGTS